MVTATKQDAFDEIQGRALHRLLTAEDLAAIPEDGNRYEIIGGKLFVSPSPNTLHQRISMKLGNALSTFLTATQSGEAFAAPIDVHLSTNDVVQPDLLVVMNERADIIQQHGIVGAPDLVVEIISPSSTRMDYLRKSKLYDQFEVREYWIVDPFEGMVSVQRLENGAFVLVGEYGRGDTIRSAVLEGFELPIATIFPEPVGAPAQEMTEGSPTTNDN